MGRSLKEYPWKAGDVVVYKQHNSPAPRIARIIDGHADPKSTMRVYLRRAHDLRAIYGEWTTTPTRLSVDRILRHATDEDMGTWESPSRDESAPADDIVVVLPNPADMRFAQAAVDMAGMAQSKNEVQKQYDRDRKLMIELDELMRIAEDDNQANRSIAQSVIAERSWAHAKAELPELPEAGFPYTCTEVIDLLFEVEEFVLERQRSAQEILSGRRYPDTKRGTRGWHEAS